jgi:hypothetical protein
MHTIVGVSYALSDATRDALEVYRRRCAVAGRCRRAAASGSCKSRSRTAPIGFRLSVGIDACELRAANEVIADSRQILPVAGPAADDAADRFLVRYPIQVILLVD